jgi:putative mycofactocin binding protein MftB
MTAATASPDAFDLGRAWRLDPQVALRPEPFGALAYHFGTRRLSFLKSRVLLDVVRALDAHPSAEAACRAAGVGDDELPRYRRALETLAGTGMIVPREAVA